MLASPLTIIERRDEAADVEMINSLASQRQAGLIIIGLPISMSGSIGQQAEKVKALAAKLKERTSIPIEFRDERLSSVAARRVIREASSKKSRRKRLDDAIAAALVLQGYLDEKPHLSEQS